MKTFTPAIALAATLVTTGCQNITIDFDTFPNGTPVPADPAAPGPVANNYLISIEYAADGVEFASSANGVVPLSLSNPPSPPNVVCPLGSGNSRDYNETTHITLSERTCNVWVTTIPLNPSSPGDITVSAFDASGSLLRAEQSRGPESQSVLGGRRVRINACGIARVELSSALNYCFDDFTWQDRLF